ncbi:MAG: dihydrolipoyllysine-residue acetyltransferase, partial [Verrucomicrobia bacterium]|nr:dihydrolipoyllysine-residue acetyltransferase [Verrucomicrobiota bacterium]
MTTPFKLPELGENIETIQVVKVLVAPGDVIAVDQPVLELETDKATVEVPSGVAGKVTAVAVNAGDEIAVGQLILEVEGQAESSAKADPPPAPTSAPGPEPVAPAPAPASAAPTAPAVGRTGSVFKLPELGENIETIQVVNVLIKPGDTVAVDQNVLELETDKATVEVPSSVAGVVDAVSVKAGDEIKVGSTVFTLKGGT